MKNFIFFAGLVVYPLLIWQCSDNDTQDVPKQKYYLRMKVDGVLKEYDTCWLLGKTTAINILAGRPGDYGGASVNDVKQITTRTYLNSMLNPATNLPVSVLGAYRAPGSTDIYISYQSGWPAYEAIITFTTLGAEVATGTFSGQMRQVGGDEVLTITEGEFKAFVP